MGLDVRVYKNVKITDNDEDYNFFARVIDEKWKYKIKNLEENKHYVGNRVFVGISYNYSYHSRFREVLIRLIERDDLLNTQGKIDWSNLELDIPFYDFIDFADNEGCLDWDISAVIFSDFEKYNNKAKQELNEYDYSNYEKWLETFKIAKDNGVVVFS
jgi:hypothetical protein